MIYFWMIFLIKYVLNKTEDLNLSLFNMITGTNESKTLTKDISCICKCRLDGRKCNSMVINRDQWWNNDKCECECKKCHVCEKKKCLESSYM